MKWLHRLFPLICLGFSAAASAQVVLETDDNSATLAGTWSQATTTPGFYGDDYSVAQGGGTPDTARFFSKRPISSSGTWCIQALWTAGANRSAAVSYQVWDGGTLKTTFTANQQQGGGAWQPLGCTQLTIGKTAEVRISDTSVAAGALVIADGVRWVWDETLIPQDYCIAVNGGFGGGGTTFIAKGLVQPPNGQCFPWNGIVKTATSVQGTSVGTACVSNDGKLFTATIFSTMPEFLGAGNSAVDHIELCPLSATQGCPAHGGQSDRGTFSGPAAKITCTGTLSTIPSSHD
ncbi:MAG: hypothetical protein U1E83_01390 [Methylotetracoccus sp.]